jgi:methylglyoxal synthase
VDKRGRVAFITTDNYRKDHRPQLERFVYEQLYKLCSHFAVLSTGTTYEKVFEILYGRSASQNLELIARSNGLSISGEHDLEPWRRTIEAGMERHPQSVEGMIEITYELVEGRLDGVIHLQDWQDIRNVDSLVLRREANVHDVPIASDLRTAESLTSAWDIRARQDPEREIFKKKEPPKDFPLLGLTPEDRVLALIAHDGKKLEMCCLIVEYSRQIFKNFDYVLATGTTCKYVKMFLEAAGCSPGDLQKVRACRSGPYGGDVQIAAAVVKRLCKTVIFLQDPFTSHPHATDIQLFEQAGLLFREIQLRLDLELAFNVETAKAILESRRVHKAA